jgi:hypothetical protein
MDTFLIKIKYIFKSTLKMIYTSKHLIKVDRFTLFFINAMFIKLVRFNKIILNIKFINLNFVLLCITNDDINYFILFFMFSYGFQ